MDINSKKIDLCKSFLGVPPYDTFDNINYRDSHLLQYLYNTYGKVEIDQVLSDLGRRI